MVSERNRVFIKHGTHRACPQQDKVENTTSDVHGSMHIGHSAIFFCKTSNAQGVSSVDPVHPKNLFPIPCKKILGRKKNHYTPLHHGCNHHLRMSCLHRPLEPSETLSSNLRALWLPGVCDMCRSVLVFLVPGRSLHAVQEEVGYGSAALLWPLQIIYSWEVQSISRAFAVGA